MNQDRPAPAGLAPPRAAWAEPRLATARALHLLRTALRNNELWLVFLAALIGIAAGLLVVAMNLCTQTQHSLLFNLAQGDRLSAQSALPVARLLAVPVAGGLILGLTGLWASRRPVDAIEANALYGGAMSLRDSLVVVAQTLLSNGFGASVGLEAGYTQIGGAVGSKLGQMFRLRRRDVRLLVGCGTAAAIGAAFNAPLTGAFYAFELVIGTYALSMLAPVAVSAIGAVFVQRWIMGDEPGFNVALPAAIVTRDYFPIVVLGILCALGGVAIMRGVTLFEALFRRSHVPVCLRPAIGGLALGSLALLSPTVLSSGHGALRMGLAADYPWRTVALLLVLKATASAISIGSGFRGGLFFASLFLGVLSGKLFAAGMLMLSPVPVFPEAVYALVGMSAMATAIVGGPFTMAFLALEGTGSLPLTIAVLTASVVSSVTVRRTFGYSFATWRFHLRGEAIRSAVDIGWMRSLTVGRMMRRDLRTVRSDMPVAAFRREFPLGSTNRVIAVDEQDRYAGVVWVADAHAEQQDATRVFELLHHPHTYLLPAMTAKEAAELFERAEADALAVVEGDSLRVIGLLTEQFTLRRYAEELDKRRRDLSGEAG